MTEPFGSAYDNNLADRSVTIASKMPNGEDMNEVIPKAIAA